ncbi:MAG TPA: hypothetical protein VGK59_19315, partial [Ohtaekwangia sp.]
MSSVFQKFFVFLLFAGLSHLSVAQTTYNVVWSDLVGSTVTGNTLTKNVADGWGNSAATGLHYLESNTDGFLEYTVDAINRKAFGLSDLNSNTFSGSIDYCFNIGADSKAYIFNNAVELANTPVVIGDVLRIERSGSTVYFKKNGATVHTHSNGLTTALLVDVSLYTNGSSLVNMKTSFGPSPHPVLQWNSVKGMSISGDNLLRTNSFSAGYGDSGAASVASLPAGQSGWIEVTVNELDRRRMIGFSSSPTYVNPSGVAYGIQFDNDNMHLVVNGATSTYMGKFTTNSVVRISREGSQIKYYFNGTLYHTSPTPSTGALYIHVGFYNQLGTFKGVYASFGPGQGTVPDRVEYEALKTFYDSLGGAGWTTKTNWPTGTWPRHKYNTEFNNWFGLTVVNGDVTRINYSANNLIGKIPSAVSQLKRVNYFRFYTNPGVTGKMPAGLFTMTDLTFLMIARTSINGNLPSQISNLTNLTWLGLYGNDLSGTLPSQLYNLTSLTDLYLFENEFEGVLPAQIGNLVNLKELWLYRNNFSGSLPAQFYNLTSLSGLYLYENEFEGSISEQIGNLVNLKALWMYRNQFTGTLPSSLSNATYLETLYFFENDFSGTIPSSWQSLTNLKHLWIHDNANLTGELPASFGNLTQLQTLSIGQCAVQGTLPSSYSTLANLTGLYLYMMDLEGTIPSSWQSLNQLATIDLKYDSLSGDIPAWLMNKASVKTFDLNNNQFTSLPDFSARTDKASLVIHIENNRIPIADIERYFTGVNTHPFDSLFYSGQQLAEPVSAQQVMLTTELRIDAPHGGVHGVYLWEKLINGTWTNINHLNYSSSPQSFVRTTAAVDDAGSYRYTVTNSWMP